MYTIICSSTFAAHLDIPDVSMFANIPATCLVHKTETVILVFNQIYSTHKNSSFSLKNYHEIALYFYLPMQIPKIALIAFSIYLFSRKKLCHVLM